MDKFIINGPTKLEGNIDIIISLRPKNLFIALPLNTLKGTVKLEEEFLNPNTL